LIILAGVSPVNVIGAFFVFLAGLAVTFISIPFLIKKMRKAGITGIDVHKPSKPVIPEMGGISILIGISVVTVISFILFPSYSSEFSAFFLVVLIAGIIGVIDDVYRLNPIVKPFLTALACIPLFIFGAYSAHPILPLVGRTRLTLLYPILLPFAIAVPANAVNMMDPLNGTMAGTSSIVIVAILISAFLFGRLDIVVLSAGLLGCLLAFYWFNRYPAKIFSGDTGSLAVGAAIGALVVTGRLEVVGVVALMPQIMNAFYGLISVGKLYEHREISARPIHLMSDGRLAANKDPKAPITLTRMILANGPMKEHDVVKIFLLLAAFCGFLAIITALTMLAFV